MKYEIGIHPDWEGYIAEVVGYPHMYAFGYTESEAKSELYNVLSMLKEYYTEQARLTDSIIDTQTYAVQV